jgi:hypothetical protein
MSSNAVVEKAESARDNRAKQVFNILRQHIRDDLGQRAEVADYCSCSVGTVDKWAEEEVLPRGYTPILAAGFLRKYKIVGDELVESPAHALSLADALYLGLADKRFTPEQVAAYVGIPAYKAIQYANNDSAPQGWTLARIEWFLHRIRLEDGRPFRPMPRLDELNPVVAKLLAACCKGWLEVSTIVSQTNVPEDRVDRWFLHGRNVPEPMIDRLTAEFAPYLVAEIDDEVLPGQTPIGKKAKSNGKATPSNMALPASTAAFTAEPKVVAIEDLIVTSAETLRCTLLGYISSLTASEAEEKLNALQKRNPQLWFELGILIPCVVDPEERYPTWKRSRR